MMGLQRCRPRHPRPLCQPSLGSRSACTSSRHRTIRSDAVSWRISRRSWYGMLHMQLHAPIHARTHPRTCITHARATCLFASSLGDTGALAFLGPPCCSPLHPSHLLCAEWRGHALGRACPLKRVCAVGWQTTSGALVSIKEQALISQIWYRTVQCTRPPAHSRAPTSPGRPATPGVQRDRRVGVLSACCAAARSIHQQ